MQSNKAESKSHGTMTSPAQQLCRWLLRHHWTLTNLAARMVVTEPAVLNWIDGRANPHGTNRAKLKEITGIEWVTEEPHNSLATTTTEPPITKVTTVALSEVLRVSRSELMNLLEWVTEIDATVKGNSKLLKQLVAAHHDSNEHLELGLQLERNSPVPANGNGSNGRGA